MLVIIRKGQDAEKRVTLRSSLKVDVHYSCQLQHHGIADGKKKVMKKERRSEKKEEGGESKLYSPLPNVGV
jgi:hypothetical protein